MPKLLVTTQSLGHNGAAHCLHDLLLFLRGQGWPITLLYQGEGPLLAPLLEAGVQLAVQAVPSDFDLALVDTLLDAGTVVRINNAIPTVLWVHEGLTLVDNKLQTGNFLFDCFSRCSRIVFQTRWQVETVFAPFLEEREPRRLCIVPAGLPAWIWPLSPARRSDHHLPVPTTPRLVWLGSVYARKRPEDLVAAMLRLADLGVVCDFYGETGYLATLEAPAREKMLSNPQIFRLRGPLARPEAVAQLTGASAFCLPSSDESFPCSIAEAAAMRVPLALSDLPGHRGVWRHGCNALLHPVGAIDLLAWNLRALVCDPALALRLSDEAYRTAAARLPQERMVQRMTEILLDALADPL